MRYGSLFLVVITKGDVAQSMRHDIILQPHQLLSRSSSAQSSNLQRVLSQSSTVGDAILDLPVGFVPFTLAVSLDIVHRSPSPLMIDAC
jgi:hypothetical protein